MATGRKPDPRRRKTAHVHASYLKCSNGESHPGWKAGEVFGCYGHRTAAQQPCLSDLTDDAMPCPFCTSGLAPVWRGYVPLWDRDWTLRYVLIGEDVFESVDSIPFRGRLTVCRAKNPISPLVVRPEEKPVLLRELPERAPWVTPIDMLSVCLTLWKHPGLTAWVEANRAQKPAEVEKPKRSDKKPFSPMMEAPARRFTPVEKPKAEPESVDNPLAEVFGRIASKNGKHFKKG